MLETPFPFFISKKPGKSPTFGTFLAKKLILFFSVLVYFHWKSDFWVRPCLKTSLWRHTLIDFHEFLSNGKGRPYPIPLYQTVILWAHQFQVHKFPPFLGKPCYKKGLVGRGLTECKTRIICISVYKTYIDCFLFGLWLNDRPSVISATIQCPLTLL